MTPQDGESPTLFASPGEAPQHEGAEMAAAYAMRPLSTGELLDRTFAIYRSRFWLFAGIASVSGAVQAVANAVNLLGQHALVNRYGFHAGRMGTTIGTAIGVLLFFLAVSVTQAATVHALSEVYLGRGATVGDSLRATIGFWYRYLGIASWQGWSAVWVATVVALPGIVFLVPRFGLRSLAWLGGVLVFVAIVGGGVYGAIAYLRNSLGIPAAVVEQLRVRASMRRSKVLTSGAKGKIFVVLLIAAVLYWVAGAIQMPMLIFIARAPKQPHVIAQAMILAISFVAHTLVSPVALIGLSLVYFDQRVRLEAFDLVMLLDGEVPVRAEGSMMPVVPVASDVEDGGAGDPIGNDGQVQDPV